MTTPYELLSSIKEDDIKYAILKDPQAYSVTPKEMAINFIRMIKLAPTWLNFIKDSVYICTNKYSDDYTYTSVTISPYEPTSEKVTYKKINDNNKIIEVTVDEDIVAKTRKMYDNLDNSPESWKNVSKSKIASNTIENFFKGGVINPEKLLLLKNIIQADIISEDEWDAALNLAGKYKIADEYISNNFESHNTRLLEDSTIHDVIVAAQEIEKIIDDNDVVVFVGNTPQLIRYPFEKIITAAKATVKTISLAISGHPDQVKEQAHDGIIPNILTPDSHNAYKEYMKHMGLTEDFIINHKIHLVDCVSSGGGLAYLTRCITEIAYEGKITDEAINHIDIIALNNIDQKYAKFSNKIESHSLKMNELTKTLDRVSDNDSSLRLMPSASSYKWNNDFIDKVEEHSKHIFDHPNEFFQEVFHKIDMEIEQILGKAADQ